MSSLIHDAFLACAAAQPHRTAVTQGNISLSYGALEQTSRSLAIQLSRRGVGPGDRVGIAMRKCPAAIAAILGVLRAGAAYVPLDEQSPPRRQRAVLADGTVRGVVVDATSYGRLAPFDLEGVGFVLNVPDATTIAPAPANDDWRPPQNDSVHPAALLYTSGSTGTPKGVVMSHAAVASFVRWAVAEFGLDASDRLASVAQISFDLSILDIFGALSVGATVHLVPPHSLLRPTLVTEQLRQAGVTTWYSVPSTLTHLVEHGDLVERGLPLLRRVLFAGEVFPLPQLRRALRALPGADFFNLFGPTETNVCTWYRVPRPLPADATAIPIGQAVAHAEVHVLGPQGDPVPPGDAGELCVAGRGLMSGYWNQPGATDAAFWPPGTVPGAGRLYRTGDWVRCGGDRNLWFLGRRDRQVKHRGYRVELAEVEAAVASVPGVLESAIVTRPDAHGCGLHAILVPRGGKQLTVLDVKAHCAEVLPAYMVPASVEFRPSLPRTSTGKIDYQRLR